MGHKNLPSRKVAKSTGKKISTVIIGSGAIPRSEILYEESSRTTPISKLNEYGFDNFLPQEIAEKTFREKSSRINLSRL